ncbi:MAG: ABC-2 family transporter protein [Chloroflexi bacterium]|nr:ABC-2 family transporter protein [Chloroflexota bacterium]
MITKYLALMKRSFAQMLEYRAGILIWMLVNVMPLVMLAVWFSLSEGGPIQGYTQSDFVAYFLLMTFVRQMTSVWVIHELDYDIRHGNLSIKLLYPLNPIHSYFTDHLTDKILRVAVMFPLAIIAWLIFPTIHYDVTPVTLTLFVATLFGALVIRFLAQYVFGLFSFWISQADTLNEIWYATSILLGGLVAPLDLLPAPLAAIAQYLPFRFMLSFPVEVMTGRLSATNLFQGIAINAGWIVFFFAAYKIVWRRGIKQFSAFGA